MPRRRPAPLYAFDPDIGRLAVTTPAYNTAIVAVNQRAFPYGGIELARLFDGDQRVAANVGGRAPAAFGLLVRQPDGRRVFSSQTARAYDRPRGHAAAPHPGAVRDRGDREARCRAGLRRPIRRPARTREPDRRALPAPSPSPPLHPEHDRDPLAARAPLWPRPPARRRPAAELGRARRVWSRCCVTARGSACGRAPCASPASRGSRSPAPHSGYTVVPLRRPSDAVARVLHPARQSSNPDPGPTLAIEL